MCAMEQFYHHLCNIYFIKLVDNIFNIIYSICFNIFFFCFREEENDTPKLNVYIPPNLRKKIPEEEAVPDRAADGSEIIESVVVETPINDVRTDPDGQSSEPDVAKDVPVIDVAKDQSVAEADVDKNDSGFIECGMYISTKKFCLKKDFCILYFNDS